MKASKLSDEQKALILKQGDLVRHWSEDNNHPKRRVKAKLERMSTVVSIFNFFPVTSWS